MARVDVKDKSKDAATEAAKRWAALFGGEPPPEQGSVVATSGEGVQPDTYTNAEGSTGLASQAGPGMNPETAMAEQILAMAQRVDQRSQAAIEEFIGTSIPQLQEQVNAANHGDKVALQQLGALNATMKDIPLPEYTGPARTSKEDLQRQKDTYAQQGEAAKLFKAQTGVGITPEEKLMMERARLEEEGSRRGAQQAALSELGARGARSGGADIAALLGAQQQTSQNRALSDLGAQANAQQRALGAMQGYGNVTGQMANTAQGMRDSGDVMSRFNQQQENAWNQWEGDFKTKQQENAWGRGRDVFDASTKTNHSAYNRGYDVYGANRDATAMKTGQYNQGATAQSDAMRGIIGQQAAQSAEEALKDDGFDIKDPSTWF